MASGVPLPFSLRPKQEVQAEREAKEQEQHAKEQNRRDTIQKTAEVELVTLQAHEEKLRNAHNPPPVAINQVLCPRTSNNNSGAPNSDKVVEEVQDLLSDSSEEYKLPEKPAELLESTNSGEDKLLDPSDGEIQTTKKCSKRAEKGDLRAAVQKEGNQRMVVQEEGLGKCKAPEKEPSSAGSAMSVSSRSLPPTRPESEDELGGLSNNEGGGDERRAIEANGKGIKLAYYAGGSMKKMQQVHSLAKIIPTMSIPTFALPAKDLPQAKEQIRMAHLPAQLMVPFEEILVPRLHVIFGVTASWESPSNNEIQKAWKASFPQEKPLEFHTPLGVIVKKLVLDRLSSWKSLIGNAGILALQNEGDWIEVRQEWCTWAVSRSEEDHPFYFAGVVEDEEGNVMSQTGIFQSTIIATVLGVHINSINPFPIDVKADRPVSALVLAIQSAKRAILFHSTGVEVRPRRSASDFLKANWGDHVKYDIHGKACPVYPTSTLVDLVNQLKLKQWEKILTTAVDALKVSLAVENSSSSTTSASPVPATTNRPKPQLRDDDANIE
ncbi:unnamed protein product [Cyclocybe aegerita]|uniref:Uncharacterized protein n=1 Tax=Cyclocybe aegerita TaxID=1973307 RepID=A0A8S0VRS8_CYCAE|nr:unnamed protein product [Cyclocybe aegerita]